MNNHDLAIDGKRRCSECGEIRHLADFHACKTASMGRRSDCKACHSFKENNRQIRQMADRTPENYMMCNSCDNIFHKTGTRLGAIKPIVTECRLCKSKDIEAY